MEDFRIDPNISYDVVELPSRGIHYLSNKKSVKVSYLTAADENILSAPNLTQTTNVVTELLKRKVLDKDIDVEELVDEDVQAILIFLRNTAFGSDYQITLIDPKTEKEFMVNVDLSTLPLKDFNLVADVNGEFSYFLEKSKIDITFKFLTQKQENEIKLIQKSWNGNGVPPVKTKELEFIIKSAKGNRDPMMLRNFIENMPIKDSQDFRKYIIEQKPGINLKQTTIAPSGENVQFNVGFGVEFFRLFYGV